MKIVQFGAGNIGRSLAGQLFSRAGWEVVFVDTVPEVIEALNRDRGYDVVVKDERPDTIRVTNVRAIAAGEVERIASEIADADLIGTAVGPNALRFVYPTIAAGVKQRNAPIDVLMCENLRNASAHAREGLAGCLPDDFPLAERVGFVETSIGKMVPIMPDAVRRARPLEVWAEAYNLIVADREGFVGPIPDVEGLVVKGCFAAYVDRKLFVHNLGHAAAAYNGFPRGYTYVWETVADADLCDMIRAAMWESADALIRRYPDEFNEDNQEEHIEDLLRRFHNPALGDTLYRVGRDLRRKLGREDRVVGALLLDHAQGVDPAHTIETLARGLSFLAKDEHGKTYPPDEALVQEVAQRGAAWAAREICGLDPEQEADLIARLEDRYGAPAR